MDATAPGRDAPLGRRLLWLGLELVTCFAVVRTHGTLVRPAFAYLLPACRALLMFGDRRGLALSLLTWVAYAVNLGLDVWPDRLPEIPNYLLFFLIPWAAAVVPAFTSLREAHARRRVEVLYAELREAHAQLEALHRAAREAAIAEERNRLAREIHDTLAHYLTVVNVQLEAAEKFAPEQAARSLEAVGRARRFTLECLQEVRRSVAALRAATLEELSLPLALDRLATDFAASTGLAVTLDVAIPADARLAPETTQALYHAAQEGLTNVQRHARARSVRLGLTMPNGSVMLTVQDDGAGPSANGGGNAGGGGFGLVGLRERVELLGGRLDLRAAEPTGSRLSVTLPSGTEC